MEGFAGRAAQVIAHLGLPQIQTCRFPASGSSSHDVASPRVDCGPHGAFGSSRQWGQNCLLTILTLFLPDPFSAS